MAWEKDSRHIATHSLNNSSMKHSLCVDSQGFWMGLDWSLHFMTFPFRAFEHCEGFTDAHVVSEVTARITQCSFLWNVEWMSRSGLACLWGTVAHSCNTASTLFVMLKISFRKAIDPNQIPAPALVRAEQAVFRIWCFSASACSASAHHYWIMSSSVIEPLFARIIMAMPVHHTTVQ